MGKNKLAPNFDPTWKSDLLDLKKLGKTAFILRQIYRLYRDPETNTCNLSDLKIHQITGWRRETIRRARFRLTELKEIFPQGYHLYSVKSFHKYQKVDAKTANSSESQLARNGSTSCSENRQQLTQKPPTVDAKTANPYIYRTDTDITDRDFKKNLAENVSDMVCLNCQNYEKHHVDSRGNSYGYCPVLGSRLPPYLNAQACANFVKKKEKAKQKEGVYV